MPDDPDDREITLIWRIEFLGEIIAQLPHAKGCSIVYVNGACNCPKSRVNQVLTSSSFAELLASKSSCAAAYGR
jgi:hypothetical protein